MTGIKIIFILIAIVTLVSAGFVVTSRRMLRSALWLVLCLLGVGAMFVLLQSSFFAVVQMLVYIGAVAILILFVVMLTRQSMEDKNPQIRSGWWWAAIAALVVFASISLVLFGWQDFATTQRAVAEGASEDLVALGQILVNPAGYALPFELASVLLVATMIGAIYVASERRGNKS